MLSHVLMLQHVASGDTVLLASNPVNKKDPVVLVLEKDYIVFLGVLSS